MQPQVNRERPDRQPLWIQDRALHDLLHKIVAEAAELVKGARLVVMTPNGHLHVLVGARGDHYPWQSLARAVFAHSDVQSAPGIVAAPVDGAEGGRAILLLYHDSPSDPAGAMQLVRACAARVETALVLSAERMAGTWSAADALLRALAAHDSATARHATTVRHLTRTLAQAMHVAAHIIPEWEWGALLHDVGKIAVPQAILRKAGSLDNAEWSVIRQHPASGERIISAIPALATAALAVRHHHEHWDGSGYPDRLTGRAIPMVARVIAVADAYETLCTGRPYRAPLTPGDALVELRRSAGQQFDPDLVPFFPVLVGHAAFTWN